MDIDGQNIDATSDPAIGATVDRQIGLTNAGMAKDYMASAPQARGLLGENSNFNSGLAYGDKANTQAIRNRYMPDYNLQQKELNLETIKSAQTDHIRNLQVATQAASQEVEMNRQKALIKWKIDQANKQARGAVLGQVLGITGAVVGGVAAGYATGGVGAGAGITAGYAAGSGLGNAVGSAN